MNAAVLASSRNRRDRMYNREISHVIVCNEKGLQFERLTLRNELDIAQLPLLSGGYYSAKVGVKWCEITVEGLIAQQERQVYDNFINEIKGGFKSVIVDTTVYSRCILEKSEIKAQADSGFESFKVTLRSVENV